MSTDTKELLSAQWSALEALAREIAGYTPERVKALPEGQIQGLVLELIAELRAARENAYELAAKMADELAAENRRSAAAVREYKLEGTAFEHEEWADAAETVARQLRRRGG